MQLSVFSALKVKRKNFRIKTANSSSYFQVLFWSKYIVVRNCYWCEFGTKTEYAFSDTCNAFRNCYWCKTSTIIKRTVSDTCNIASRWKHLYQIIRKYAIIPLHMIKTAWESFSRCVCLWFVIYLASSAKESLFLKLSFNDI